MEKKRPKAKAVPFRYIEPDSEAGRPLYALMHDLIESYHEELTQARIALAWQIAWQPDVDGHVTLSQCRKVSELAREVKDKDVAAFDFILLLSRTFWEDPIVRDDQRQALLDHALYYGAVTHDVDGEPVVDERSRTVYRIRKPDIVEFSGIVARYGTYTRDLENFAKAVERGRQQALSFGFVGRRSLQARLREIHLALPYDVIAEWSESERAAVNAYLLVQLELKRSAPGGLWNPEQHREGMPVCLAAALAALEQTA